MDNKSEPNFDSQFEELTTEWRTLRNLTIEVAGGFRGSWEKMFEMRISFFDKLILLSSGTFALSLTMLGSLHSHAASGNPLVGIGYLKRAWVLMLVSILCSWTHNLVKVGELEALMGAMVYGVNMSRFEGMHDVTRRMVLLAQQHGKNKLPFDEVSSETQTLVSAVKKGLTKFESKRTKFSRVATFFGGAGILTIISAFTLLLVFALKNASLL